MITISFLTGSGVFFWLNTKRGIPKQTSFLLMLSCFLFGILGGLGLTLVTSYGKAIGLSSLGGLAGMYLSCLMIARISKQPYYRQLLSQNCTLVLPLMYSIAKIGCHFAGCCRGIPYTKWGSITYYLSDVAGDCIRVFPVQLTESIVFALIFLMGMILYHKRVESTSVIVFLLSAASKMGLDYLRGSHLTEGLSVTQLFCIFMIVSICIWYLIHSSVKEMREYTEAKKSNEKEQ